jgi:hypothetical protein
MNWRSLIVAFRQLLACGRREGCARAGTLRASGVTASEESTFTQGRRALVTFAEFKTIFVQIAAFPRDEDVDLRSVLRIALAEWGQLYTSPPISVPLPAEFPGELPGVILSNADSSLQLQAGRQKVAVVWERKEAERGTADVFKIALDQLSALAEQANFRIGRIGVVMSRAAQADQPGKQLARQFCRDEWLAGPLNRPDGFELHAHKVFALVTEVPVNSWIRIRTAKRSSPVYNEVSVEQDINTLVEEQATREFARGELQQLLDVLLPEFDKVLAAYFPASTSEVHASGQTHASN